MQLSARLAPVPRLVPVVVLVAMLLVAIVVALLVAGSQRHLPPPFGLARNGAVTWVEHGQIFTSESSGEVPKQITPAGATFSRPVFSRDGTKIAYERWRDANAQHGDVVVADADGSDAVVLDHDIGPIGIISWSADGRYLAYMVEKNPPAPYPLEFVERSVQGAERAVIDTLPGDTWGPSWSPDGKRLAVGVDPGGHTDLYVVDRDGSNARKLNRLQAKEGGDINADWSPDGSTIAFGAGDPELGMAVYLVGLDGAPERRISDPLRSATNVTFSPDGSRLAYVEDDATGLGWRVVIADSRGRTIAMLPGHYGKFGPIWSPDGTRIAIVDDRPGPGDVVAPAVVVILDVAGNADPVSLPAANPMGPTEYSMTWQRLAP